MKLLVVDDEPNVREMMRLTLETAGYEVDEADSGEVAIAMFSDGRRYDGVLLDQKMPGLDGLETLRRILAMASDTRIIMVTAFASIELAVDAMRLGAAHFLRKPMTPETLRGAVAAAIAAAAPRSAGRATGAGTAFGPQILTLTMNGFRIENASPAVAASPSDHVFMVTRPDGKSERVTVTIDAAALSRVARLTRRDLAPSGAFWRRQAERRLADYLWSEGRVPDGGRLTVDDVSRNDVDIAVAWPAD